MNPKNKFLPATCWLVIFISAVNILGWIADIDILKTAKPGLPSMKFNTAICVVLCSVSVLLAYANKQRHFNTIIPLNLIVLIISMLTLFEYVFKINLKIDEFLVKEETRFNSPGRMALTSAACLTLLSVGFCFIIVEAGNLFNSIAKAMFYAVTIVTLLAITGYVFNIPRLHSLFLSKSMALITAVVLLPLSLVYTWLIPQPTEKLQLTNSKQSA